MKKIFPNSIEDRERLTPESEKPVTQQQYQDLVNRTNAAEAASVIANENVDALREEVSNAITTSNITTDNINSETGCVKCLTSDEITSGTASIDHVSTECVEADSIGSSSIHTDSITACTVTANCASITDSTVTNANVTNATVQNLDVTGEMTLDNLSVTDAEFTNASVTNAEITNATIETANAENVTADEVTADELTADKATVTDLDATNANLEFITHTANYQNLIGVSRDQYIELPMFTNGTYYLEGRTDGDIKLFAIEISNSDKNLMYRWSQASAGYIKKVIDASFDDGTMKVYVVVNTQGNLLKLYHQSTSTDNTNPPTIWDETVPEIPEPYVEHEVVDARGTYLDNLVVTDTLRVEHLEMDWLDIDNATIYRNLALTCGLDEFGYPVATTGNEFDYLAVSKAADGTNLRPHWDTPVNELTNGAIGKSSCQITEKAISQYNGTSNNDPVLTPSTATKSDFVLVDDKYISDTDYYDYNGVKVAYADSEWKFYDENDNQLLSITTNVDDIEGLYIYTQTATYPIAHLNNTTCVEGANSRLTACNLVSDVTTSNTVNIECCLSLSRAVLLCNPPNSFETLMNGQTTSATTELLDEGTIGIMDRDDHFFPLAKLSYDNLSIPTQYQCIECKETMPVVPVYTCCCYLLKPANDIFVPGEIKSGSLNVDGDTHITGDLYVSGKTITQEEETISTGGDAIVLRQNKATGLSNTEIAGVIVHNYDGNDNNSIVGIDNTGTVRVGDATGTDTTYTEIWLNTDDELWYDTDGTTVISVTGELTSYASKTVEDNFVKYTNAVFTVFNLTDLEPVATRDEASNMTNNAFVRWDATDKELKTISAPASADMKLVSCADPITGAIGYCWTNNLSDQTPYFRFDSMTAYEAYIVDHEIPVGSTVEIDNEDNWVMSEDIQ